MKLKVILTVILLLLFLLILPLAVWNDDSAEESEVKEVPLADAIAAMEANPRFSVSRQWQHFGGEVSADRPADRAQMKFILPDRFSFHEEDVYDKWPYSITIGNDFYSSQDGIHWEEVWNSGGALNYALWNPYTYVRNAMDPVEVESETIDGKLCRVFEAELDVEGWAMDNLPPPTLSMFMECSAGEGEIDRNLVESLGYEFLYENGSKILSDNVYISTHTNIDGTTVSFHAEVKNATEFTSELKKEFTQIVRALGMESCNLDNATVRTFGSADDLSQVTGTLSSAGIRIYVEEASSLPHLLEVERRDQSRMDMETFAFAIDITYDESIRIEKPQNVLHEKKAESLFHRVQDTSGELQHLLRAFKQDHGVYPQNLDAESMRPTLETLSRQWPDNALTGEAMIQKKDSPGDYYYQLTEGGTVYELILYDYDASPIDYSVPVEDWAMREYAPETAINSQQFLARLNATSPTEVLPPLTKNERAQAQEIAITDPQIVSLLENTDPVIWDVYPCYSGMAQKAARVVLTYFANPYKIEFGGLSVTVDLESTDVIQITRIPEDFARELKDNLYYENAITLPPMRADHPERHPEAIEMALADPRVQGIVEGSEYVISRIHVNAEGQSFISVHFFEPVQIADSDVSLSNITINVNLEDGSVTLQPASMPISAAGVFAADAFANAPLSPEQQASAIQIAFDDVRVQEVLHNREYEIWKAEAYPRSPDPNHPGGLMGASLTVVLSAESLIEYDWPMIRQNEDGSITEEIYPSTIPLKALEIIVDLEAERVLQIFRAMP